MSYQNMRMNRIGTYHFEVGVFNFYKNYAGFYSGSLLY